MPPAAAGPDSAPPAAASSLDDTTFLFTRRLTTFRFVGEPPSSVGVSTFREPNFSAKRLDSASESDDAFFLVEDADLRGDFADTRRVPGATGCITREEEEEVDSFLRFGAEDADE